MAKADDVIACFDCAFKQNTGVKPDPDKLISDYNITARQFQRILDLTRSCLKNKGWTFTSISTSLGQSVLQVFQGINKNTTATPGKKLAKKPAAKKRPASGKADKKKKRRG